MNKEPCRICGNTTQNERLMAREMVFGSREQFFYLLCSCCGSLSIETLPCVAKLASLYSKYPNLAKTSFRQSKWKKWTKSYILSHENSLAKILLNVLGAYDDLRIKALFPYKIPKSAKILDVGSGSGSLISELRELGYKNCIGIDPFLDKDIVLSCGGLVLKKDCFQMTEQYDWIFFHHSFEHVFNPKEIIKKVCELLNPGGICLIRFPNIESYSFQEFKEHWEGIHAPFHLFLPSQKGMQHLLENTDLQIVETRGEQLYYLFLYTLSHIMDVADFEELGVRANLESSSKKTSLFTRKDIRYWKKKTKQVLKNKSADYINYYLKKRT